MKWVLSSVPATCPTTGAPTRGRQNKKWRLLRGTRVSPLFDILFCRTCFVMRVTSAWDVRVETAINCMMTGCWQATPSYRFLVRHRRQVLLGSESLRSLQQLHSWCRSVSDIFFASQCIQHCCWLTVVSYKSLHGLFWCVQGRAYHSCFRCRPCTYCTGKPGLLTWT